MKFTKIDELVNDVLVSPKIDTSNWKEEKLVKFFPEYDHGSRLTKANRKPGKMPLVTAGKFNNGITQYVASTEKNTIFSKCITIDMFGNCFYQENEFICDDNVYPILGIKNKYVGLFLCSVFSNCINFEFKKQFRLKHLTYITIKLPIDVKGNPDWEYMENYIKQREIYSQKFDFSRLEKLPDEIKESKKFNCNDWIEVPFIRKWIDTSQRLKKEHENGIFDLCATKSGLDNNKLKQGIEEFNLVTRTDKTNGIARKVAKQNKSIENAGCITIGLDTQTVFWQKEQFYTGQNINIINHPKLANEYIGLFIIGVIKNLIKSMFTWGSEGATLGRLFEMNIKLPYKNNKPDWEKMEQIAKTRYDYFCRILGVN